MKEVKKDPNRIARVNSKIEHELGPILLDELRGFGGMVTISRVDTSADMKWAKVWISIFGGEKQLPPKDAVIKGKNKVLTLDDKILKHLNDNIYHIQGELNKHFTTKIIPRLSFHLDTTPRYAQHIEEVIRKIHDEENSK